MAQNSVFEEYNDDSQDSLGKLAKKSKDSPFVPIGKNNYFSNNPHLQFIVRITTIMHITQIKLTLTLKNVQIILHSWVQMISLENK